MVGPVVVGRPVPSRILLIGQAPGPREGALGRPFAWTAGRTLFRWFASLGVDEETFRSRVYVAAVCRCFPGKTRAGGDRVPDRGEVEQCGSWMAREVALLRPGLLLPVGKLAIDLVLARKWQWGCAMQHTHLGRATGGLEDVVGHVLRATLHGVPADVVALPHPSGLSTWWKIEPGRTLLAHALESLGSHPTWRRTFQA
jgi:uracil-DNA glycosylase